MSSTAGEFDGDGANAGHIAALFVGFLLVTSDLSEVIDRGSFDGSQLVESW
jgi:hypothetical protein